MAKQFLLENVSVDTIGTPLKGDGANRSLTVWGDLGAGQVTIDISDDGTNFVPVTENGGNVLVFDEPSSRLILKIPPTQLIRAKLQGSTSPSGVNVMISG